MKARAAIFLLCLLSLSCEVFFSDSDIDTVKDLFKSKEERQQEKTQKSLLDLYNNVLRRNTNTTTNQDSGANWTTLNNSFLNYQYMKRITPYMLLCEF